MNIAFVGLAYSHPYVYCQLLERTGHRAAYVWDDAPDQVKEFAHLSDANPVARYDDIPVDQIDGAILTGRLPERIDHAIYFLEQGVPIYTGKPMATSEHDLDRLIAAVRRTGTPLLTTSVLRFAPVVAALRRHLTQGAIGQPLTIRAAAAHKIDRYMEEPHIWQDDPARGGGTLLSLGVHALEMLSVIVGTDFQRVACQTARRFHTRSLSEDVAIMTLEWANGLLGSVEINGGVNTECYELEVSGSEQLLRASIPKGDIQNVRGAAVGDADPWVEFGYTGTIAAFVEMCQTREMPVPLSVSEAITRTLLAARIAATTGTVQAV